jgi:hypothetical protein
MDDRTILTWSQPQASLVVRQGTQVGTTFPITGDEAILGREEGIDVSVRDPEVSRRHARVFWEGGNYYVEDLGSTNGTFLNGALVTSAQPLRSGDTIGVGQTVLVFQAEAEPAPERPAARAAYPSSPPAATERAPAVERGGGRRCLLIGCGCLIALGVLLILVLGVLLLAFPQELEDLLNSILNTLGLEVDVAMRYAVDLVA